MLKQISVFVELLKENGSYLVVCLISHILKSGSLYVFAFISYIIKDTHARILALGS